MPVGSRQSSQRASAAGPPRFLQCSAITLSPVCRRRPTSRVVGCSQASAVPADSPLTNTSHQLSHDTVRRAAATGTRSSNVRRNHSSASSLFGAWSQIRAAGPEPAGTGTAAPSIGAWAGSTAAGSSRKNARTGVGCGAMAGIGPVCRGRRMPPRRRARRSAPGRLVGTPGPALARTRATFYRRAAAVDHGMRALHVGIGVLAGVTGGPATYGRRLVAALAALGEQLQVTVLTDRPDAFAGLGCGLVHLPMRGGIDRLRWQYRALPRALVRLRPAVYHDTKNALPLAAVVTVHDLAYHTVPETFGWLSRTFLRRATAAAVRRARIVVVPSQATATDLARIHPFAAPKLQVVPHGI